MKLFMMLDQEETRAASRLIGFAFLSLIVNAAFVPVCFYVAIHDANDGSYWCILWSILSIYYVRSMYIWLARYHESLDMVAELIKEKYLRQQEDLEKELEKNNE